jgi:RNA recognition motif-containing protein
VSIKLYIGNLSFSSTESDLQDAFGRCGGVESVTIVTSRETGRPRGFAFVEMEDIGSVRDAIRTLDGTDLGGRNIRVREAHSVEGLPYRGH